MAYIPSEFSVVGWAKETTPGTVVAPTNYLRLNTLAPVINVPALYDQSMQASMAKTYDAIPGVTSATYQADGNLYADEVNVYLQSILGDIAVSGAADPYTTTHAVLNTSPGQPKTYTITDYNGNNARALGSARCSSLNVKWAADGLATVSAQFMAINYATAATPTPSFPAGTHALPGWKAQASINSVTAVKVLDMEFDIKRTVTAVPTLSNSQAPDTIFAGGDVECSGSATIIYDTAQGETTYGLYLAQTQVPISIDLLSTESAAHEVKFQCSVAIIDSARIDRASGRYVQLPVTFYGIANSTDAGTSGGKSPVKAITKAQLPSGTFA